MSLPQFLRRLSAGPGRPAARTPAAPRRGFAADPAAASVELLEGRVLLSGTGRGTRTVTAAETGAVTVDAANFERVVVEAGADIGTLTINGADGCDIDVSIAGSASSLNVQGASGAETVTLQAGGSVGSVQFNGGAGNDSLIVDGTANGSVTYNGGEGADVLRLAGDGAFLGGLSGGMDAGADAFEILGAAVVDNVSFGLGAGDDAFTLSSTTPTTGNFTLSGDEGADTLTFAAGTTVTGNESVDAGAGADTVLFGGHDVVGNQSVSLGDSGLRADTLRFADGTIQGGSDVSFDGDATITETAARDIASLYTFTGADGTVTADLTGGSRVAGDFTFTNDGVTNLTVEGMDVTQANFTVNTGSGMGTGADAVRITDTTVGGNFTATLGGDEADADVLELLGNVRIGDPAAGTNGNQTVNLGGGDDRFVSEMLLVNGNQTLNLGASTDTGRDTVRFGRDTINGGSAVNFGGGLDLTETAARDIASDYAITAQGGQGEVTADLTGGSTVDGNFSLTTFGRTDAEIGGLTVDQGNFTLSTGTGTGTGTDTLDLTGEVRVGGNFTATLGGSEEDADVLRQTGTLRVGDPATGVNGNMDVSTGGGGDEVEFTDVVVNGNQSIALGAAPDTLRTGDQLTFGTGDVRGSSSVTFEGAADIRQTDGTTRDIQSDYTIAAQGGNAPVRALLGAGNRVGGNFEFTSAGATTLEVGVDVAMGNATINTGSGAGTGTDVVRFLGDSEIGGNVDVTLGGSEETVDALFVNGSLLVGNPSAGVNGNFTLAAGGGDDVANLDGLTVTGSRNVNLGAGDTEGADSDAVILLESGQVGGSRLVTFAGDAVILQADSATRSGNLTLRQTSAGTSVVNLGGDNVVGGSFRLDTLGETTFTGGFERVGRDVFFNTGEGDDDVLVRNGGTIGGKFDFDGGAGDDRLSLADAEVGGDVILRGRGGDDELTVSDTSVGGLLSASTAEGDDALTLAGLTAREVSFRGGDGDDTFTLTDAPAPGGDPTRSDVRGPVTVRGGSGDNTALIDASRAGTLALSGEEGADEVTVRDSSVGNFSVNFRGGEDTVTLDGATVRGEATVRTGEGDSTLTVENGSEVRRGLFTSAYGGADDIVLSDSTLGELGVRTRDGVDSVTLDGATVSGVATVRTGEGDSTLTVENGSDLRGGLFTSAYGGADTVGVSDSTLTVLNVRTRGGADSVTVDAARVSDYATFRTGEGTSTFAVTDSGVTNSLNLFGGSAADEVTVTGGPADVPGGPTAGSVNLRTEGGDDTLDLADLLVESTLEAFAGEGADELAVGVIEAGRYAFEAGPNARVTGAGRFEGTTLNG